MICQILSTDISRKSDQNLWSTILMEWWRPTYDRPHHFTPVAGKHLKSCYIYLKIWWYRYSMICSQWNVYLIFNHVFMGFVFFLQLLLCMSYYVICFTITILRRLGWTMSRRRAAAETGVNSLDLWYPVHDMHEIHEKRILYCILI